MDFLEFNKLLYDIKSCVSLANFKIRFRENIVNA